MLNEKEKIFVEAWKTHRLYEARFIIQLLKGLPVGLLFALPIVFILVSSKFWFKRADMVANSKMSWEVIAGAVLFISFFVGVLYKRHQWEMKEQQYKELKRREALKSGSGA